MVGTRDDKLAKRVKIMRLHGINRDAFNRYQSRKPAWEYEVVAPGFKYNMTDVAAAMGRVQLTRIGAFTERRTWIAEQYFAAFADLPLTLPARPQQADLHAWHIFAIRLQNESADAEPRDRFIQALADAGIGTSVHYIPLHRQPYWRDRYELDPMDYPNAERAYWQLVSLPLYTAMSNADVEHVINTVRAVTLTEAK
jgi:dTDP-4-amino-4,6-dideoxygalactose transaminase